jgi:mono/diheme cytochrome c family protein
MTPAARAWARFTVAAMLTHAALSLAATQPDESGSDAPAGTAKRSGQDLYETLCQACHMEGGVGAAGVYPALAHDQNLASTSYLVSIVLNGRRNMPSVDDLLTDQQIAAVLNYIRTRFGNDFADPVSVAAVSAARREASGARRTAADVDESARDMSP